MLTVTDGQLRLPRPANLAIGGASINAFHGGYAAGLLKCQSKPGMLIFYPIADFEGQKLHEAHSSLIHVMT